MIEPFIAAFAFTLISEIADKTQLVILGLALKFKSPFKVFFGALLAHGVMDGLAIIVGTVLGVSLMSDLIKNIIGIIFIILGLWTFAKLYMDKKKEKPNVLSKSPLAASFLLVLLSEFGDKTQITSGLLAAKYLVPVTILIGVLLALLIIIGLNVFVGSKIAEKIPIKTIKISTAVLFVLFGIFTLLT